MSATTEKKKLGPTDVLTPEFRASYPTLFEARAATPQDKDNPEKRNYGVEMWFRVASTPESIAAGEKVVDVSPLMAAAEAACTEAWGHDKAKWPKGYKHPFKKGEANTGKNGPIPGVLIVRAQRKESFGRPVVVDQNVQDVIDKTAVYAGMYLRAKLHAYVWKHPTGGNGVSFTLDMVQIVRDGEPLGNSMNAADAFDAIPLPAGAQQAAKPQAAAAAAGGLFGDLG